MTLVSKDYTNVILEPSSECFDESTVKEQAKQVTQVAVAEQQNSIGEIKKFQSFSRLQKLFRVIALVIKFVRILQLRMEDKKKEEKYTRVLRSTFKEIKRDKEAKTVV